MRGASWVVQPSTPLARADAWQAPGCGVSPQGCPLRGVARAAAEQWTRRHAQGEWVEGRMHGQGTYVDGGGHQWEGQFYNGAGPGLTCRL